jgi:anti-sigma factor RsiW
MKTDTQHLDFLISQYVDGSLDTASRKSMEQRLLTDPESRKLYTDHREVQDLLDDWGNRIPLINWDDFDNKLASRLEKETVGGNSPWLFRRWMRPVAAAAALFLAASVGYNWHDWWGPRSPGNVAAQVAPVDQAPVTEASIAEPVDSPRPSIARFRVDDAPDLQSRPPIETPWRSTPRAIPSPWSPSSRPSASG